MNQESKVIVALDFDNKSKALNFVSALNPQSCKLKIGKEMFTYFGPDLVKTLVNKKFDVFLDLKFHDIPNTVAKACLAAADLGIWMVNVHASGGPKMMEAAYSALDKLGKDKPKLIAVTVLTSMDYTQLNAIGINQQPNEHVLKLASLAKNAGLDGVVCSAMEASVLREMFGKDFCLVTPGIRPEGSDKGDQLRIMTPSAAIIAGADYMVIGRPITQSPEPLDVLNRINLSIQ